MMYEDYINLLRKISHHYKNHGIDFDDLMGIANETYLTACKEFDKNKSKFSTYLYTCVKNQIIIELEKESRQKEGSRMPENIIWMRSEPNFNTETRVCFLSHLKSLSDEAQEILKIVLSSPSNLLKEVGSLAPKKIRGGIYRKLLKRNWPQRKIWKTFREIKEALK